MKEKCFAYDSEKGNCSVLKKLYCKKENCRFYKTKKQLLEDMSKLKEAEGENYGRN